MEFYQFITDTLVYSQRLVRNNAVVAVIFFTLVSGCSYFGVRSQTDDVSTTKNFSPRVAATQNVLPVPIEVASDVATVMTGEADAAETVMGHDINNPEGQENVVMLSGASRKKSAASKAQNRKVATVHDGYELAPQMTKPRVGGSYVVRKGDTLMKIAFDTYGDLYRWREILEQNKDRLGNFNFLVPGTTLVIGDAEFVVVEKNGQPYLIKKSDTLGKISKSLYGNTNQWRSLWNNNKQLIHNPNKIYAGFTLYYQEKGH